MSGDLVNYSGVCFHIFFAVILLGFQNVVRYNRVFVVVGCHCI